MLKPIASIICATLLTSCSLSDPVVQSVSGKVSDDLCHAGWELELPMTHYRIQDISNLAVNLNVELMVSNIHAADERFTIRPSHGSKAAFSERIFYPAAAMGVMASKSSSYFSRIDLVAGHPNISHNNLEFCLALSTTNIEGPIDEPFNVVRRNVVSQKISAMPGEAIKVPVDEDLGVYVMITAEFTASDTASL